MNTRLYIEAGCIESGSFKPLIVTQTPYPVTADQLYSDYYNYDYACLYRATEINSFHEIKPDEILILVKPLEIQKFKVQFLQKEIEQKSSISECVTSSE